MTQFDKEPTIEVGIVVKRPRIRVQLAGSYRSESGELVPGGDYSLTAKDGRAALDGPVAIESANFELTPEHSEAARFILDDVTIGIGFHWQRDESQVFGGALKALVDSAALTLVNRVPLESYLVSVISSEMSANCPAELLRAHAIVSRSWLIAQLKRAYASGREEATGSTDPTTGAPLSGPGELIRWYDRESHSAFDVCADDHCQRYQGVSKAVSPAALRAVTDTRGMVLTFGGEVCDARFSKSCGGMTELFASAWENKRVTYLTAVYDGGEFPDDYRLPLTIEANAESWITGRPPAYCSETSPEMQRIILTGFDQETGEFYRWRTEYSQRELREIIESRLCVDFGRIRALEPVERGESGRIIRLRIVGEQTSLVIGKELEIRRALSRSHLYSSAFVVRTDSVYSGGFPEHFVLLGGGWGHGVGLCQVGAAVMANRGIAYDEILRHYFRGAIVERGY